MKVKLGQTILFDGGYRHKGQKTYRKGEIIELYDRIDKEGKIEKMVKVDFVVAILKIPKDILECNSHYYPCSILPY